MLPSAHNLYLLQNISPWCVSQTVQLAEESIFAERRYLACVINVNSQHACVQIEKNAALWKFSKRIFQLIINLLTVKGASRVRGEAPHFRCGLLGVCAHLRVQAVNVNTLWRLRLAVFEWLKRTWKGSLSPMPSPSCYPCPPSLPA